jgi:cleavage and polyadenylation specificity factor subunit 1
MSGQDNVVADALSRVESVTAPPTCDAMAASQDRDDELRKLLGSTTSLRLEKLLIPGTTVPICCDTSSRRSRPYVPAPLRLQVFQSIHDRSHPGTKAPAKLVTERFLWQGVQKDCRTWVRACQSCQRSKVSRHTVTPVGDFTPPAARFLHVHMDLLGPLPASAGYMYCLTAVDLFTCWTEVFPIPDVTADTVAHVLLTGWISRFRCPPIISTFPIPGQSVWHSALTSVAHHSAANGLVGHFHRTLKTAIMCHADQQWTEALPLVVFGIQTAFREDL